MCPVTTDGHLVVMSKENRVGVAELKARLSHYLRLVQRGERVMVLDRERPVAQLVPVEEQRGLVVRPPRPGAGRPGDIRPRPGPPIDIDVVALVREERGER